MLSGYRTPTAKQDFLSLMSEFATTTNNVAF